MAVSTPTFTTASLKARWWFDACEQVIKQDNYVIAGGATAQHTHRVSNPTVTLGLIATLAEHSLRNDRLKKQAFPRNFPVLSRMKSAARCWVTRISSQNGTSSLKQEYRPAEDPLKG